MATVYHDALENLISIQLQFEVIQKDFIAHVYRLCWGLSESVRCVTFF